MQFGVSLLAISSIFNAYKKFTPDRRTFFLAPPPLRLGPYVELLRCAPVWTLVECCNFAMQRYNETALLLAMLLTDGLVWSVRHSLLTEHVYSDKSLEDVEKKLSVIGRSLSVMR